MTLAVMLAGWAATAAPVISNRHETRASANFMIENPLGCENCPNSMSRRAVRFQQHIVLRIDLVEDRQRRRAKHRALPAGGAQQHAGRDAAFPCANRKRQGLQPVEEALGRGSGMNPPSTMASGSSRD